MKIKFGSYLMNISIIVASLARKGPVIVANDIANGLNVNGHNVTVYFLDSKFGITSNCLTKKLSFSTLKEIANSDIVHTHSLRPDIVGFLLKIFFRSKARFISTIHNYVEQDLRMTYGFFIALIFSKLWRLIWAGFDQVVVLSRDAQNYYKSTVPPIDGIVIYNGKNEHIFNTSNIQEIDLLNDLKDRYRLIGANAVVTKRKGLDIVIRSLPELKQYVFVLVGDGPEITTLKYEAAKLNVSDRFFALGFKENARDYLKFYDVFAMPSYSEGVPLAMLEAVDANIPVVCSNISIFRELFDNNEVSFFELNNVPSFIMSIISASKNKFCLTKKARIRFANSYSDTAMIQNYTELYEAILANKISAT